MRWFPQGRSRARRRRRSYQPQCTVPQVPQTVFSPPHKGDKSCLRVTEQTLHALQGAKAGEAICIRQATGFACFRHRTIMPKSRTPETNILCCKNSAFSTAGSPLLPTRNHEEPVLKTHVPLFSDVISRGCGDGSLSLRLRPDRR